LPGRRCHQLEAEGIPPEPSRYDLPSELRGSQVCDIEEPAIGGRGTLSVEHWAMRIAGRWYQGFAVAVTDPEQSWVEHERSPL
jgi:hypothetical protein